MSSPANRKLFAAAKKGNADGVQAALAAGADVTARDGNGWIALHEAARWGRLDAVRALLAAGSDPSCVHADLGYTPLIVAAFTAGNAAILRALIDGGAAVTYATEHGYSALTAATAAGDPEMIEILRAAATAPTRRPPVAVVVPREQPFVEARPIAIAKIAVSGKRTAVAAADIAKLGAVPAGYAELLAGVGPGTLAGKVRVYGPRAIARERATWRARIAEYWFWGDGPLLTKADAARAERIADTVDGDELVFHPRAADTLLVLPRERTAVELASRAGLLPALARLLGRVPRALALEPLDD